MRFDRQGRSEVFAALIGLAAVFGIQTMDGVARLPVELVSGMSGVAQQSMGAVEAVFDCMGHVVRGLLQVTFQHFAAHGPAQAIQGSAGRLRGLLDPVRHVAADAHVPK